MQLWIIQESYNEFFEIDVTEILLATTKEQKMLSKYLTISNQNTGERNTEYCFRNSVDVAYKINFDSAVKAVDNSAIFSHITLRVSTV